MAINRIVLVGRLVADPELRYTATGNAVANFRIAVDRQFTSRDGEKETDFIDIVCWRKLAELVAHHLDKGRLVAVDGRLQIRSYEDKEGVRRRIAEVVADTVQFLDWPSDERGAQTGHVEQPQVDGGFGDDSIAF